MMIFRLTLKLFTSFREIIVGFLVEMQKPKQPGIAPAKRPFVDKPTQPIQLTPDQAEAITVAETVSLQMASPAVEDTSAIAVAQPVEQPHPITEISDSESATIPADSPPGWESVGGLEEPDPASPVVVLADRKVIVHGHLTAAWQQGLRTYPQLIKYVELQTGTGCSKRMVSDWKKSQLLNDADPLAA